MRKQNDSGILQYLRCLGVLNRQGNAVAMQRTRRPEVQYGRAATCYGALREDIERTEHPQPPRARRPTNQHVAEEWKKDTKPCNLRSDSRNRTTTGKEYVPRSRTAPSARWASRTASLTQTLPCSSTFVVGETRKPSSKRVPTAALHDHSLGCRTPRRPSSFRLCSAKKAVAMENMQQALEWGKKKANRQNETERSTDPNHRQCFSVRSNMRLVGRGPCRYALYRHKLRASYTSWPARLKREHHSSTTISTADCADSSSLPRPWWPLGRARTKPLPRSGMGPRGCRDGRPWPRSRACSS